MQIEVIHELSELFNRPYILTANQRLSINLKRLLTHQRVEILPLNQWLEQCWFAIGDRYLLNPLQEKILWQTVLDQQTFVDILHPHQTAQLAQEAWQTLKAWNIDYHETTDALRAWCQTYENHCLEKNVASHADILPYLKKHQAKLCLPESIALYGFDELTPALEDFLDSLTACKISQVNWVRQTQSVQYLETSNTRDEILQMAHFAKRLWEKDPSLTIGCVVPNLTQLREQITQIFSQVFTPTEYIPGQKTTNKIFNLSAGVPLSECLVLKQAYSCLSTAVLGIQIETFGQLLQSPYFAQKEEDLFFGAKLARYLGALEESIIPIDAVFGAFEQAAAQTEETGTWLARYRAYLECVQSWPRLASISQWATYFKTALQKIGWPGFRTFSSIEYQMLQRFIQLLVEYSKLDLVLPEVNALKALHLLEQLMKNTLFQAEGSEASIQILGVLESGGELFDHLWVMGMTDEAWPASPQPNPLIPQILQKKFAMPHASAQRELEYSEKTFARWLQSTHHLYFSYAKQENDKKLSASAFLKDFPLMTKPLLPDSFILQFFEKRQLETVCDDYGPVLTHPILSGGSATLQKQALCPFRGFVNAQLNLSPLKKPSQDLTHSLRGNLVHTALLHIWQTLKDHETLMHLSNEMLQTIILDALTKTLSELKIPAFSQKHALLILEKKRLQQLLLQWLLLEKTRDDFTVACLEIPKKIQVEHLTIRIQIDRIDQRADKTYEIIDYKTGRLDLNGWFDDRLTNPQLPLYCAFDTTLNYKTVSFAQIKAQEKTFKGLTAYPHLTYANITVAENWEETLDHWREKIKRLSQELQQGFAKVDPFEGIKSCQYCELSGFCRVELQETKHAK